jgi:hypothetical protein
MVMRLTSPAHPVLGLPVVAGAVVLVMLVVLMVLVGAGTLVLVSFNAVMVGCVLANGGFDNVVVAVVVVDGGCIRNSGSAMGSEIGMISVSCEHMQ